MEEKPEIFTCLVFRFCVFDEYQRKQSIHRFFAKKLSKNHENAKFPDFQFHNLKFSQERYFGPFMLLQPQAYIWNLPLQSTLNENFGSNESINFNYHYNKLVSYRSFFFTALSYSLQYEQFLVPFIDSNSRLEEKYINYFTRWTGKNLSRSPFIHKALMIWALLKIRHSNTSVFLWVF